MGEPSDGVGYFGSLFVEITGRSSLTERQRVAPPVDGDGSDDALPITEYVASVATANGLDDAIEEPEGY